MQKYAIATAYGIFKLKSNVIDFRKKPFYKFYTCLSDLF